MYQHATTDRDAAIATALSELAAAAPPRLDEHGAIQALRSSGRARPHSQRR